MLGDQQVKVERLIDHARCLALKDFQRLEHCLDEFERRFPQIHAIVFLGGLLPGVSAAEAGFWLLNQGVCARPSGTMPNRWGLAFIIDPVERRAGLSMGYALEACLPAGFGSEMLQRAAVHLAHDEHVRRWMRCWPASTGSFVPRDRPGAGRFSRAHSGLIRTWGWKCFRRRPRCPCHLRSTDEIHFPSRPVAGAGRLCLGRFCLAAQDDEEGLPLPRWSEEDLRAMREQPQAAPLLNNLLWPENVEFLAEAEPAPADTPDARQPAADLSRFLPPHLIASPGAGRPLPSAFIPTSAASLRDVSAAFLADAAGWPPERHPD